MSSVPAHEYLPVNPFPRYLIAALLVALAAAPAAQAQQNPPHAGYVYPAGGRQGDTFRVTVGGQYLERTTNVYYLGPRHSGQSRRVHQASYAETSQRLERAARRIAKEAENAETVKEIIEIRDKLNEFQNRRANPVLADKVTLQIRSPRTPSPASGNCDWRRPTGCRIRWSFRSDNWPSFANKRRNQALNRRAASGRRTSRSRNAHARTGDEHHAAGRGERANHARRRGSLSVPGPQRSAIGRRRQRAGIDARIWPMPCPAGFRPPWRFAIPQGNELAYGDHYRFHPDPVLYCKIPEERAIRAGNPTMRCTAAAKISSIASPSANCLL